ncbi:MAG: hypothetical protein OEV40_13975 [Acidimicrobiia bacterium]|nr:hypothetical protein [Acidimicrobiia bacterium]
MTIEKGAAWGRPMTAPADAVPISSDAELATAAAEAHARSEHLVAVLSPQASGEPGAGRLVGDVARTLGLRRERPERERLGFPFDLGFVRLDGGPARAFVAHMVARRRFWTGEFAVVMNSAWMGEWYLGPRAHPNDGLLDVTVGSLPAGQRLVAWRRLPTGSHLPHPQLTTARGRSFDHRMRHSTPIMIDGQRAGRARSIEAWIEPDCFTLVA